MGQKGEWLPHVASAIWNPCWGDRVLDGLPKTLKYVSQLKGACPLKTRKMEYFGSFLDFYTNEITAYKSKYLIANPIEMYLK